MSSIASIERKLAQIHGNPASGTTISLTSALSRGQVLVLEQSIKAALDEDLAGAIALPPGVASGLVVDLIYCLVRHRRWLATTAFADVAAGFLTTEWGLPGPMARRTVAAGISPFGVVPQTATPEDDQEFLRYIFVISAVARSEDSLIQDLGFGDAILRHIRTAAQEVMRKSDGDAHNGNQRYIPPLQAAFAGIMVAMSKAVRQESRAIDHEHLRFLLHPIPDSMRAWLIERRGIRQIFDSLLALGRRANQSFERWLTCDDESSASSETAKAPQEVLAFLQDRFLIHRTGGGGIAPLKWSLTRLGEDLTAESFAQDICLSLPDDDELLAEQITVQLAGANGRYQEAVIRVLRSSSSEFLSALVTAKPTVLAPVAIEAAARRLVARGDDEVTVETWDSLVNQPENYWAKASFISGLCGANLGAKLRSKLLDAAQEECSASLRSTLLEALALDAHEKLTAETTGLSCPESQPLP